MLARFAGGNEVFETVQVLPGLARRKRVPDGVGTARDADVALFEVRDRAVELLKILAAQILQEKRLLLGMTLVVHMLQPFRNIFYL